MISDLSRAYMHSAAAKPPPALSSYANIDSSAINAKFAREQANAEMKNQLKITSMNNKMSYSIAKYQADLQYQLGLQEMANARWLEQYRVQNPTGWEAMLGQIGLGFTGSDSYYDIGAALASLLGVTSGASGALSGAGASGKGSGKGLVTTVKNLKNKAEKVAKDFINYSERNMSSQAKKAKHEKEKNYISGKKNSSVIPPKNGKIYTKKEAQENWNAAQKELYKLIQEANKNQNLQKKFYLDKFKFDNTTTSTWENSRQKWHYNHGIKENKYFA